MSTFRSHDAIDRHYNHEKAMLEANTSFLDTGCGPYIRIAEDRKSEHKALNARLAVRQKQRNANGNE